MPDVLNARQAEGTEEAIDPDLERVKKWISGIMGDVSEQKVTSREIKVELGELPKTTVLEAISELRAEGEERKEGRKGREAQKATRANTILDSIADMLMAPKGYPTGRRPNIGGEVR